MNRYCFFCKESLWSGLADEQFVCHNHSVDVIYWFDVNHASEMAIEIRFNIKIKDKFFKVMLYPYIPRTQIFIQKLSDYINYNDIKLLDIEDILNISPENAKQKLPIILTFS